MREILIHSYSRADAIADGFLIDVTETAKEAGFTIPVALTNAVWCEYVEVPLGVRAQDEAGRLWDILTMLRFAARTTHESTILFRLSVRKDNREGSPPPVTLKAVCSPGDDGTPCITVMEPSED